MNLNKPKAHIIDYFFILALFCVFTASALVVVLIGVNVYQSTITNMNENYTSRTSLTYVTQKIRQNDAIGDVSVGVVNGTSALILEKNYNDVPYCTYIYTFNGELKELFIKKGQAFSPGDGESIMAVQNFAISRISEHLIKLETTNSKGTTLETFVSLECDD